MAKFSVTSEQYYGIAGQLLEIQRQLRMKGGSPLEPERVKSALQGIIEPHKMNSLAETVETAVRLKEAGYLDTSFEGKAVHSLIIRPLTKEQAFDEYRNSGGKTWIWNELKKNMPYITPKAETLDVMIMKFNRRIESGEGLEIMDNFGVRSISLEQLIQYGIARPDHQKRSPLVSLTKILLDGDPNAPDLWFDDDERRLDADLWGGEWVDRYRFPVVRK